MSGLFYSRGVKKSSWPIAFKPEKGITHGQYDALFFYLQDCSGRLMDIDSQGSMLEMPVFIRLQAGICLVSTFKCNG